MELYRYPLLVGLLLAQKDDFARLIIKNVAVAHLDVLVVNLSSRRQLIVSNLDVDDSRLLQQVALWAAQAL